VAWASRRYMSHLVMRVLVLLVLYSPPSCRVLTVRAKPAPEESCSVQWVEYECCEGNNGILEWRKSRYMRCCSGKALALNHVVVRSCTSTILRKPCSPEATIVASRRSFTLQVPQIPQMPLAVGCTRCVTGPRCSCIRRQEERRLFSSRFRLSSRSPASQVRHGLQREVREALSYEHVLLQRCMPSSCCHMRCTVHVS